MVIGPPNLGGSICGEIRRVVRHPTLALVCVSSRFAEAPERNRRSSALLLAHPPRGADRPSKPDRTSPFCSKPSPHSQKAAFASSRAETPRLRHQFRDRAPQPAPRLLRKLLAPA